MNYQTLKEASEGKIKFKNGDLGIHFNAIVENFKIGEDNNIPTLIINNEPLFKKVLNEYIDEARSFYLPDYFNETGVNNDEIDKYLFSMLWSNATVDDFTNPIPFIKRRINFIKDKTFDEFNQKKIIGDKKIFDYNVSLINQKKGLLNETPKSLLFTLEKDGYTYKLPRIFYGIENETCYIYAIQKDRNTDDINKSNKENYKFLNRVFYKINSGYNKSEEEKEIDDITDITPSFIIVLTLFVSLLNKYNINKLVVNDYLPIRYINKVLQAKSIIKNMNAEGDSELLKDEENKINSIQYNLTNKFIRNFKRLEYHFENINFLSLPFELGSNSIVKIDDFYSECCNNQLLSELVNCVLNLERGKKL